MVNKFWIAFFAFATFVFAVMTIGVAWFLLAQHEPIRRVIVSVCLMSFVTWQIIKVTISRVKYGPRGPRSTR